MKKSIFIAAFAAVPCLSFAQSAIDAYNISGSDLRGTARFMSMAGAFSALGGDLSTLNQNPAGLGVYRSSEIGITLDVNMTSGPGNGSDKTHVYCNNFGYVGSTSLGNGAMPTFSWGATYSRVASFDRIYSGGFGALNSSMSNYIANFSAGYAPSVLGEDGSYNPFQNSTADWLSIMAYNSYMINPTGYNDTYNGLFTNGTTGDAEFSVRERGYIDEYSINFGGNIMNTVYWGIGFGITDLSWTQEAFYDEQLTNARVYDDATGGTTNGDAYTTLSNFNHISGSGFNVKLGLIFKPINEFRLGIAVHTPTWYNLSQTYDAKTTYSYGYDFNAAGYPTSSLEGDYTSDVAYFDWRLKSPWRLIVGGAGVIGGRFILSADYEYAAYNNMSMSAPNRWNNYVSLDDVNSDIKTYYQGSNTLRLGAEYRITPRFSVRAGYSYVSSNVKDNANNGAEYIYTSGTNPAYAFNKTSNYVTFGLGYRFGGFYVDAAYVHKNTNTTYHAYSPYADANSQWTFEPYTDFSLKNNNIVLTLGYKF
ncbi:MAG: hypothetical protein K2I64_03930 [Muribaculaceae bacterium]|nr:hypothetical protein [Muribaculaceae bacterium]